jgi:hypothetical protein
MTNTKDLIKNLPVLLPLAATWAESQSRLILHNGIALSKTQLELARCVGVRKSELIRILVVKEIPRPENGMLKSACMELNFLGPDTQGLTLSYGVFIKTESEANRKLLAHEFRHVAQYEQHSSIMSYLSIYIPELFQYGYDRAPLEIDAESIAKRCV